MISFVDKISWHCGFEEISNSAVTDDLVSWLPIKRLLDLKPIAKPRESSKIDLPEPVSPDKMHKPFSNSISALSIKTMLLIISDFSTSKKI